MNTLKVLRIRSRFPAATGKTAALSAALMLLLLGTGIAPTAQDTAEASPDFVYPGDTWQRITDPSSAGYSQAGLDKVTEYVKTLDTTGLLVVVGGRVLYEYGDLEQLSYLASVRKSILSILYGKYVMDRTIRLDTTLEQLGISDIDGLLPVETKATIGHLITARSGIYHPASNSGDSTASAPPRGSQEPGRYFLYNNWDFNCAGYIFEKLTHQTIYDALERDLRCPSTCRTSIAWPNASRATSRGPFTRPTTSGCPPATWPGSAT